MSSLALTVFPTLDALPPSARALLDRAGAQRLFTSRPWFESFIESGLPPGTKPLFFVLEDGAGQAQAILPCQLMPQGGQNEPTTASLTSFYSCDFRPLIAPGPGAAATAFALGRDVARHLAGEAIVRFDSLESTWAELKPFLAGLSAPGRALLRYAHFGRWSQSVEGQTFAGYLAGRDGGLREVIRRKGARLEREGAVLTMTGVGATSEEIERGIADYEAVYAASWKEAEPFPHFQPTLMRALAKAAWLRLAICRIGDRPVAAQLWVMTGGVATVLKLAHDRTFDSLSPGTVLTAFAIRNLMENERVASLDFGRGDDPYKRAWTSERTQHIGVLWTGIARRPGLVARHFLGQLRRRIKAGGG